MREKNFNTGLRGVLFEAQHYARMGPAVWLYGWLILRETSERNGIGFVLGGHPVTYREIEEETGFRRKSLERWMHVLRRGGYIETTSAPGGVIVRIQKAKKFLRASGDQGRESFQQPWKKSEGKLWKTSRDPLPLLKSGDTLRTNEEAPPQICGAKSSNAVECVGLAAGIRSRSIEREIEKQKTSPISSMQSQNEHSFESFPVHTRRLEAGRITYAKRRALRSEEIERELRVGAGPETSE